MNGMTNENRKTAAGGTTGGSFPTGYRTHTCGELRAAEAGSEVTVAGWVSAQRDHGGLIFIDLRDRWGEVQVAVDPAEDPEGLEVARAARLEDVVQVTGTVRARPESAVNPEMTTGDCEVHAHRLVMLAETETPPFVIGEEATASEEMGLTYRYLDLRRPPLQRNLALRHRAAQITRRYFDARGFLEIETPFLIRSTPEGARDYLVPSRLHHGRFYALPQSPQQYKQLLMMSGFDRYVQIVRCFRDEDLRADRQPEFTQVDVEMSFVGEEDVIEVVEGYVAELLRETRGVDLHPPFERFGYDEAMRRFGTDRPDLRFGLEIVDLSPVVSDTAFKVFRTALEEGGLVGAIAAPGYGEISRSEGDRLGDVAREYGAAGAIPLTVSPEGLEGPVAKFLSEAEKTEIVTALGAEPGALVIVVAGEAGTTLPALGALRLSLARQLDLIDESEFRCAWVRDFPLLEWSEEEARMVAVHHPFTSAAEPERVVALAAELIEGGAQVMASPEWRQQVCGLRARAYDVVLNGIEIAGGSIRNHRMREQSALFTLLGMDEAETRRRFGFLLTALGYGAPPHGGIAFGFDRLVMILAGAGSLREVIAFPKTTSAMSLMDGSPAEVSDEQLDDLGLKLRRGVKKDEEAQKDSGNDE